MRRAVLLATLILAARSSAGAEGTLPDWVRIDQRPGASSALPPAVTSLPPGRRSELAALDYPYADLLRRVTVDLEPDGRLVERETLVRYMLNAAGVRDHGNVYRGTRSQVARVILEEAWVRRVDGRIVDFDPSTLQIVSDADPDVFSDVQHLVFAFANLEPGATLVLVTRQEMDLDAWPLDWSRIYLTQGLTPTESFEVSVSWDPGATPPPRWATDDPDLACNSSPGILICSRSRVPPLPFDPEVEWADRVPQLVVGAAAEWSTLARRELALVRGAARNDDGVESLAEELALDGGSDLERLERIHRFVADRIRYVAFEHGSKAVIPHPAARTLARGFGDCKDKVALFLALASRAGLAAYPVLVSSQRYSVEKLLLPSWLYFDHMIACVALARPFCVDLTDPHIPTGQLPLRLGGAVALELSDRALSPLNLFRPRYAWRIEVEASIEIDCDGRIREQLERRFVGSGAAAVRAQLAAMSTADRQRWMVANYTEIMGDRHEPEVGVRGLRGVEPDLTLESVTRFDVGSKLDGYTSWAEADAWLLHYARLFRTSNQHHPYRMTGLSLSLRSRFRLCPEARVRFLGARLDLRSRRGSLTRRYARVGDREVVVETHFEVPAGIVPVAELESFNRFLDNTLAQTRIWFGIESATGGGRVP